MYMFNFTLMFIYICIHARTKRVCAFVRVCWCLNCCFGDGLSVDGPLSHRGSNLSRKSLCLNPKPNLDPMKPSFLGFLIMISLCRSLNSRAFGVQEQLSPSLKALGPKP